MWGDERVIMSAVYERGMMCGGGGLRENAGVDRGWMRVEEQPRTMWA